MLTIGARQMDALLASQIERADGRLVAYARGRFPDFCADLADDVLRNLASRIRIEARHYGLAREEEVATFLDLALMYGEDFPWRDWARHYLDRTEDTPSARLAALARAAGLDDAILRGS